MAKKKSVKKRTTKRAKPKKSPVKRAKTSKKKTNPQRMVRSSKRKINLTLKNLILFGVLAVISFILYNFLSEEIYKDIFLLLTIILGFIGLAFLIVLLVFLLLRLMKK